MPIYEYNGKRYNIPEAKIEELVPRMPGAKLIEHDAPDREVTETVQQHEQQPVQQSIGQQEISLDTPKLTTSFNQEMAKQSQSPRNYLRLGQNQGGIADINRTVVYPQYKQKRDDKRALKNDLAALGADLQSKIDERDKQNNEKWAKEDEGKSTARKVLELPNPYTGMASSRTDPVRDNYQTAKRHIDEANLLIENVESGAKALKGITDEVFDPNTWLLGLDEIGKNSNIKEVVRKYENKEELTDDEEALLDALALNMAAHAFYASDLPRQYKWGQIAGESLPFMIEFMLNPIAGGGKGIAKTIASRALKKFAVGKGGRTAIKAGSRIIGDAVGAAGMTLTTGAPRTIADAMNRNLGEATFARGETGEFEYAGHEGGVDPVRAGLEAFLASTIEYQSEMVGSAGVGKLLKKTVPMPKFVSSAMGNLKASGIGRAYKGITNSNAYKEVRRVLERGQWSGTFGEYGEELYGTAMNAILVGDSKLSDLVDIDEQVDTFMGLAITGGVTGSVSTGAYVADRARTSYKLSKADETGGKYFQDWEQLKDQLADYSIGELADAQKDVLANKDIPKEGRRALSDYIYYSTYQQALIGANEQRHEDNKAYAKTENAKRLRESIANKQSVVLPTLNKEKEQLEAELGDLVDLTYEEVANSPESTPELLEAKRRHDIVNAEYEGVMEQLKTEVDEFIAPQVQAIQDVAKDGVITELNVGTDDAPDIVYLVKGDVSINEDGTIDTDATSPMLTVKNSEGKKRMIARSKIATAQQDDLNTIIHGIQQRAYEKFVRPLADKMEDKTHFNQGEQVEYVNAKGETVAGTVVNKQNNTVTVVSVDGKKTETLTEEQLSQQLLTETIDDVKVRDVIQVEIDGEIYDANVISIQDGKIELYIPSFPEASGRYQDVTAEELRKIRVVPQAETIKKTDKEVKSEGAVPEQIAQNDSKTPEAEAKSQITPEQQAEAEKQQFLESLPVVESGKRKGQIDQSQMTPEQNIKYFEYQYGQDKAIEASQKMAQILNKRIASEQKKLDNDPFNIELNENILAMQGQLQAYKAYVDAQQQQEPQQQEQEQQEQGQQQPQQQEQGQEQEREVEQRDEQQAGPLFDQKENIDQQEVHKINAEETEKISKIFASVSNLAPVDRQLWAKTSINRRQANKILKDIREFQDAAIENGTIEYKEHLGRHNYEIVDGKEVKINTYKLNGYTIEIGHEGGSSTHGASGFYTQVENPQGEILKIYNPKYRTEKTNDISYQHPRFIEQQQPQEQQPQEQPQEQGVQIEKEQKLTPEEKAKLRREQKERLAKQKKELRAQRRAEAKALAEEERLRIEKEIEAEQNDPNLSKAEKEIRMLMRKADAEKEELRNKFRNAKPSERESLWGDVQSLREHIMRELIKGQKILWEDSNGSKGFAHHLGLKGSETERRKYIGLLGSAQKTNAKTPEQFAHVIWEDVASSETDQFFGVDAMEILDEVLDVLYTHTSKGQMIKAINSERLDDAFAQIDSEVNMAINYLESMQDESPIDDEELYDQYKANEDEGVHRDISDEEYDLYYKNQVTYEEFEEQIRNFKENFDDYGYEEEIGSDREVVEQGSEAPIGEGRDNRVHGSQEAQGEIHKIPEDKAEGRVESSEAVRDREDDQSGESKNAQGPIGRAEGNLDGENERRVEGKEDDLKALQDQLKEAKKTLKDKQKAYDAAYNKYLDLRKKAENDPLYGMRGQGDMFGGVAGQDNIFVDQADDINSDIRKIISNAKQESDRLGEELNAAQKEADRIEMAIFDMRANQQELFKGYQEKDDPIDIVKEAQQAVEKHKQESYKKEASRLSEMFGVDVEMHENLDGVNKDVRKQIESGGRTPGWYQNGKVHIYLPHTISVKDLQETFFHEVVAHKGMRELLGDGFNDVMLDFFDKIPKEVQAQLLSRYKAFDVYVNKTDQELKVIAADEFIASVAENGEFMGVDQRTVLQRIIDAIKKFFNANNIEVRLADVERLANDYLRQSAERLEQNANRSVNNTNNNKNEGAPLYRTKNGRQLQFNFLSDQEIQDQKGEANNTGTRSDDIQREKNPFENKLGRLKPGEFSHVERVFTEKAHFDFTGSDKIETVEDVVSIFDKLEDSAVENSFVVYEKNGRATVQHLGMGGFSEAQVNVPAMVEGARRIEPDKIYFVHNHPSGTLIASKADTVIYKTLKNIFGDKLQDGIIINLKTGKYGIFNDKISESRNKTDKKGDVPVRVFSFDKIVFDKNHYPENLTQIKSPSEVASFISGHRLGERDKMSFLVVDRQLKVVANFFTDEVEVNTTNVQELAKDMLAKAITHGGQGVIVYGRFKTWGPTGLRTLGKLINTKSGGNVNLIEAITIKEGDAYESAAEEGVLEAETKYTAESKPMSKSDPNNNDIRFRHEDSKDVTLFKYGEGGTKGVFKDSKGNLYKSLTRQENVYDNETKSFSKRDVPGETNEYEILKELQDNRNIVKVRNKVDTKQGPMFEMETLNEVDKLTYNEYNEIKNILKGINDQGYFVNDFVTVMRRPETNELVIVDFSSGIKNKSLIGNPNYDDRRNMNRLKDLLTEEDKEKVEIDDHNENERRLAKYIPGYEPDIRFRTVDESGFYSTVESALEGIKQDKGTPQQFKAMLLKNGAKQAELDWMDYDGTFTGKSVTKTEIQDWIDQNRIEVQEVEKGNPKIKWEEKDGIYTLGNYVVEKNIHGDWSVTEKGEGWHGNYSTLDDAKNFAESNIKGYTNTKYSQYTLPGGENYKELLLTMPTKETGVVKERNDYVRSLVNKYDKYNENESPLSNFNRITRFATEEEKNKLIELNGKLNKSDQKQPDTFKSSHFDEPNILAHVRFNERTIRVDNPGYKENFIPDFDKEYELIDNGDSYQVKRKSESTPFVNTYSKKIMADNNMGIQELKTYLMEKTELGKTHPDAISNKRKRFKTEKVLFIEEIQSDWAQEGKKKGFKQSNVELRPLLTTEELDITQSEHQYHTQIDGKTYDVGKGVVGSEEAAKQYFVNWLNKEIAQSNDRIQTKNRYATPGMPFKKTDQWVNLALRRMMRYAAENDFDRIAWTTGEQQAERYDLSKQVDWIEYGKNENGTYWFALPVEYSVPSELTEQELESYVGKDIAMKMIEGEGVDGEYGGKRLQGNDLKVGGKGMIAFYDRIVPKAAGKLGKPFGANVEVVELPETGQQLSIPVTEKMKESVQEGMPLFRTIGGQSHDDGRAKKADDLFDNIDNLKSVIKDYSKFLGDVFDGAQDKSGILAEAKEKGFDKLGEVIEEYLSNVEDPTELNRIKELLGVDMPDNALRYMLWRNANPNDGSVAWKAKDAVKTSELDDNILFRSGKDFSKAKLNEYESRVRSRHNRGFRSLMYGIEEGWFDRMASLRILQNAITGGKAVPDKANAYMLENQLTSRNTADIRYYTKNLVDPFVKQIHDIFGRNINAADEYMNAKHGLERNDLMAEEEAKRKYAKNIASLNKEYADEKIDEDTYNEKMEAINGKIEAYAEKLKEEKDYSGLTAIAAERGREDFKAVAQEIVAEVEGRVPKEDIDALWSRVNKATKWILDKQYNAGIMTKETYEKIRNMYKYYVPLRGFEEVTATDLYEYIDNSPSNFEGTVKKAYGRTSKAESPTATIMSMGESGIMQANRNRMKQAFYRLVATNPSNYASIEDVWFVQTADGYEERFPKIDPTASADEVLEAIADFNNEMEELAAEGQAFQGRNKLDVGVKIMKAQASEHVIRVWIAGEEKVIFINGNPRAAQAINGLLQKKPAEEKSIRHGVEYWSRQMAANFTSRNPAFMVTNLMRDIQFAVISAAVKEGIPYSMQLAKNITLVGKTISANVFKDGNKDNAEFQKYWEEFEANGGETGYANLHSIDYNKKYVNKKLREFSDQRDFLKPFRDWVRFMENGNRMIEDMSRFATYVTSRQMGRSIERSVSDAKEITINFNRKGSGGSGANIIHSFYLFSNPALQSMRLLGMMAKNHPVRFTAMLSSTMAAGFMVPMFNELLLELFGDDDDKEKYQNITPWVRRNNLVMYVPGTKDKFVTLMLPHELRAFYGIGEMAYEKANGGLRRENMVVETAKQLFAMAPIDPMSGPDWLVPDVVKPLYQAHPKINRNFMGSPIYRDTPWNKLDPEWTKAYRGTPELLVEAAKGASDMTGGDDVVPGWINANPARAYHIFSGYLGGFMTTYTDMSMIAFNLLTGRDVRANDVPVVNKLIRTSDEKTEELRINSEYFYYIDWIREYEHRTKGYEKRVQDPEYRDKYMDVMRDKEQRMYNFAKGQIALIDQLKDYDEEKANEMKEQFVRKMWEYEDRLKD